MIENCRRACQDAQVCFDCKCKKLFNIRMRPRSSWFHLLLYRHLWKHKMCEWNYETWTKRRIVLSFHTGMVWPGIKMIQTEYRLVSVGVSVGPAYGSFKNIMQKQDSNMHERCEGTPKGTQKERKWNPMWNWWPLFIWTWITMDYGVSVWGVPYRLCRFHKLLQSSRQLLVFTHVYYTYYTIYIYYKYRSIYLKRPAYKQSLAVAVAFKKRIACSVPS